MFNISSNKKFGNYFKVLILILIFFLILSSVWLFSCKKTQSVPETAMALRGDIVQSVDVSGNVDSSQEKKLSLPASGKVLKSVEMGDTVKKGNILIEIDSRKTKLLISQAQENIKVADSSLKLAEINYKAALDANHVAIQVAQENNRLAQQASDNALNNLENTNGAGNEAIDSANTNLSNAKNQSDISIQNALKTLQDAQNSYNSSINQAQTALDQAKYQLSKTSGSGSNDLQLSQYEAAVANAQAAYNSTVSSATASLDTAQNAYNSAVVSASSSIDSAAAAVASSEAQARLNSESAEGAYKQALINQSITYWNMLSSLEQAEKQISATLESIVSSREQVNLAKINFDIASLELENCIITMPFDGLIKSVGFKEGEYLNPGVTAVTVISNDFIITADIEETDIGKIKQGQEADIILDAYPDEKIKGVVDKISPISKNTAGVISFQVDIKPEDAKSEKLLPGLSANLTIYTSRIKNVILIPSLAVFEENGKSYVWILNEKNEAVRVEVTAGASDFENTEIKSGIKEGDKVLLSKPEQSKSAFPLTQR